MSRIRIGNQTSKTAASPTMPFEYALKKGFDAFEWFPDKDASGQGWEEKDLLPGTRERIRGLGLARDISFSVHAPIRADVFNPDPVAAFRESLKLFEDIGASHFIVHFPDNYDARDILDALTPLIYSLREKKGYLSIENTPSTSPGGINRFFSLLKGAKISDGHVGLCLDLGHANIHDTTRNDYLGYIHGIEESVPVIHVHAHENYGDADSHLPLFSGPSALDDKGIRLFIQWLKQRDFRGVIIMEQWPYPPELLGRARDRLMGMF